LKRTSRFVDSTRFKTQYYIDFLNQQNETSFLTTTQVLTVALEHYHWLGVMTLPGKDNKKAKGKQEPVAITLTQSVMLIVSVFALLCFC
jgi:hypothetical protein